jgi:uncharacterized protein (TIGR03790 family)
MIDDTLSAERNGLQGNAYFDARWHSDGMPATSAYQRYDQSIHVAATYTSKRLKVVLDQSTELFPEQSCVDAALYCGWYSLTRYVDSFSWKPGAIGYHIASSECMTLRDPKSSLWCPAMLTRGAAAVIGPVNEPYLQGFPPPEIFFGKLVEGYMGLGECYFVSVPYLSWQMVLVGDPLYQPFRPMTDP